MLRTTLRSLAARKLRLALTATAVVLGVAFVTGTFVLTDTSSALFDEQFADVTRGVDLIVRTRAAFGAGMGVEVARDPVDEGTVEHIRATQGVAAAVAQIQGQALLFTPGDEPIVPKGPSIGLSWTAPPLGAFALREGAAPSAAADVVIDAATAMRHDIKVGDRIRVQGLDVTERLRVSGIAGFGTSDGIPDATVALFDDETAATVTGVTGGASQVLVVATDSGAVDELRGRLEDELGDRFEVVTSRDSAAASAAAAKTELMVVQAMLLAIAATALLVGAFLIANTFAVTVTQRLRELAMLRAVGATGRQILASVLTEAAVVGLGASAVGSALGVAAAYGMRAVVRAAGMDLPNGALVVTPRTLVLAVTVGVGVTVVSALAAARRAARIAPVQAMRQADAPASTVSSRRRVAGGLAAVVGGGLAGTTAAGTTPGMAPAGAAALLVIVALALLAPAFAGRLAAFVGRPLTRAGLAGTLARASAQRSPRRTAATTTALAVGLAVVTFITVLAASVGHATTAAFDDVISADLVVESARGEMLGGLSRHVHHRISELDEVGAVSKLRFGHWQHNGSTKALAAVDPTTLSDVVHLDVVAGDLNALDDGGVAIGHRTAEAERLSIGDRLPMTFARTGRREAPVVAIFDQADQWAVGTSYVVSLDSYAENFAEDADAAVFVKAAHGVSPAELRVAVDRVVAEFPTAAVRDHDAARQERVATIDRILSLVTVLLLFAVLIGLLGITNTLALSIVERTREIGLLRAVGMTRDQVRAMIRWEAVLVAVLGAIMGTALGIGIGWIAVRALGATASVPFRLPAVQLLTYLGVVAVAGLLAGLVPARRAARLRVLEAIAR